MRVILIFFQENFVQDKWAILGLKMTHPHNSGSTGMVKLNQVSVNWILKQSGHDFFHDYYKILKQPGHDYDS